MDQKYFEKIRLYCKIYFEHVKDEQMRQDRILAVSAKGELLTAYNV